MYSVEYIMFVSQLENRLSPTNGLISINVIPLE